MAGSADSQKSPASSLKPRRDVAEWYQDTAIDQLANSNSEFKQRDANKAGYSEIEAIVESKSYFSQNLI